MPAGFLPPHTSKSSNPFHARTTQFLVLLTKHSDDTCRHFCRARVVTRFVDDDLNGQREACA